MSERPFHAIPHLGRAFLIQRHFLHRSASALPPVVSPDLRTVLPLACVFVFTFCCQPSTAGAAIKRVLGNFSAKNSLRFLLTSSLFGRAGRLAER